MSFDPFEPLFEEGNFSVKEAAKAAEGDEDPVLSSDINISSRLKDQVASEPSFSDLSTSISNALSDAIAKEKEEDGAKKGEEKVEEAKAEKK